MKRRRLAGHDPGRVLADLAVMIACGGECISDLAVLRHQPAPFGRVASTATAWRVLEGVDETLLAALRAKSSQALASRGPDRARRADGLSNMAAAARLGVCRRDGGQVACPVRRAPCGDAHAVATGSSP